MSTQARQGHRGERSANFPEFTGVFIIDAADVFVWRTRSARARRGDPTRLDATGGFNSAEGGAGGARRRRRKAEDAASLRTTPPRLGRIRRARRAAVSPVEDALAPAPLERVVAEIDCQGRRDLVYQAYAVLRRQEAQDRRRPPSRTS